MKLKLFIGGCAVVWLLALGVRAETVSVVVSTNASPRVLFGADKIAKALGNAGLKQVSLTAPSQKIGWGSQIIIASRQDEATQGWLTGFDKGLTQRNPGKEGFQIYNLAHHRVVILGGDDSGVLYGCLELAKRISSDGKLPEQIAVSSQPGMTLRGVCVGMQKTYILPGRKVYEYPYTPELFPWFYDKKLWTDYLDFLVENRMNTLYLWNGHPFASLVRVPDYPDAVEVSPEVFAKNVEMFHWLTTECDKRGIWLVQMFYNIFLPKPLAKKYGVPTQLSAPTPLASDYTRKVIAEFVRQYPHVGLLVCLGEALQGTENQLNWATNTILPGVLDGMREAGLKEQPPVVIRTHAMDPQKIMPACYQVYSNLFTMTKYNGESLTTYEPRGKVRQTHQDMAQLGPHIVNVHILSNLEPFRYGATEFIRKSILAARDLDHACGLHLYPLSYWNWPYSPDIAEPPLLQWNRDWIWFEAWARYAWNPDVPEAQDRIYWTKRIAEHFGCDAQAAGAILDAYNAAGEVAPMLVRRFGITEGNRQTLSLGMTLDQLVNPAKYNAIEELWLSQAPPGERLPDYVEKEWKHEPHVGETPVSVTTQTVQDASNAVVWIQQAAPFVKRNQDEFARLKNDFSCIQAMAQNYAAKVKAAELVLRYGYSHSLADMEKAAAYLAESFTAYQQLDALTEKAYHYANSMQTAQRRIPVRGGMNGVGTNYLWSQLVPFYRQELQDFEKTVAQLKTDTNSPPAMVTNLIQPWPAARFKLISTNAEVYTVKVGAKVFTDRKYTIQSLAPELVGLTGIRFSHDAAKSGRYEPIEIKLSAPSQVLVGYFNDTRSIWLQVPKLEFAAQADDRGGLDSVLDNAATIEECPNISVHAFRYGTGRQKLEFIGKGSFVILGVVPQSVELKKRDAKLGSP